MARPKARRFRCALWLAIVIASALAGRAPAAPGPASAAPPLSYEMRTLRLAIEDLTRTCGERYPRGVEFLARLKALDSTAESDAQRRPQFDRLKQEALLANPLLVDGRLLLVKRRCRDMKGLGLPSNHECNSSLPRENYDNEIAILAPIGPSGKLTTLYRPEDGGYVGEINLHWDADRLLFTRSHPDNWRVWEVRTDGAGLRQVSQAPDDVDCFDACYLPSSRIIFGSTASYQSVPCWHGQKRVSNLYTMEADGSGMRQVCFDQDHDFHPTVLPSGQVLYHRWDYTGINHVFMRQLMVMNPDGTGQRAVYGSNSWFPNALYFPRPLPGSDSRLISIVSGYHGVHRMGQLMLLDTDRGWHEAEGMVQRISGRGDPIQPDIKDDLVSKDWPKFLHPFPLSDKYFLVAAWLGPKRTWGIYLADVFDNLVLVREEPDHALLQPVLLAKTPRPPVIPDRVDMSRQDATVYLHDVYAGPGLSGVPRGTVKALRVLAYNFAFRNLGGPDRIGRGGPWEAMRILGTVPVEADGSAAFEVPACTPLAVQPLDAEGKAVQLMRSWFTAMPGEQVSCVGCHERPAETPLGRTAAPLARTPRPITPWHGPARGFDFGREVQPVLDAYCVACHDGESSKPDLRSADRTPDYRGLPDSDLGHARMDPTMLTETGGLLRYSPAYDALVQYVRRVAIEDDVSLLRPGEYHADTSALVQLLKKGHQGVRLDAEAWDRLVTWIDLNAPFHGTWNEVYPVPQGSYPRRTELRKQYGGPAEDPESIPDLPRPTFSVSPPQAAPAPQPLRIDGWPFDAAEARRRQSAGGEPCEMAVDLGEGVTLRLVRIPAGQFIMGDLAGEPDEAPLARVAMPKAFWIGACEITNEQFRRFDPGHDPRYYTRRHERGDDQGLPLNDPKQPAVRVSWQQAVAYCDWLSRKTGKRFALPTEAQWEYACRAGSAEALSYGRADADFSPWANVADECFSHGLLPGGKQITGGLEHLWLDGAVLSDARFRDGHVVTAPVASFRPNAWGLYDMHGNAAEWTASLYRSYPYHDDDGRNDASATGPRVVRGGSFYDPPNRCRSAHRLSYPQWQQVFNVGFRVVCVP